VVIFGEERTMSDTKECPVCGGEMSANIEVWQTTPIEDALRAELAEYKKYVDDDHDVIGAVIDLTAELAELREAARWIPVSERLPEKWTTDIGEEYLVTSDWLGNKLTFPANYNADEQEFFTGGHGQSYTAWKEITHWRPLPQPPEEK
jgi:hypothetical protein